MIAGAGTGKTHTLDQIQKSIKSVKYIEQLNELDTDEIEPMLGGLTDAGKEKLTIREDIPHRSLGQKAALDQAPSAVAGHFQVPKVL